MKKYLLYSVLLLSMAIPANSSGMNSNMVADGEGVTYISDHYFNNQKVHYKTYHGMGIMEGDILLGPVEELEKRRETYESNKMERSTGVISASSRWPNGVIPYMFDSSVSSQTKSDTLKAMQQWNNNTPIHFVSRSNQKNYITITSKYAGCYSSLGFISSWTNGKQILNLQDKGCGYGEALHELGHTIGLHHEHNRIDRDNYINVLWNNIPSGWETQFRKNTNTTGIDIGSYDYYSIMHYAADPFNSGDPWFLPYHAAINSIGQLNGLSSGDIEGVRKLYSDKVANMISPKNGTKLPGSIVTFKWNKTYGNYVYVVVRTANRILSQKWVYDNALTVNNLPKNGEWVTVKLSTYTTNGSISKSYTYDAFLAKPTKPTIVSPTNIASSKVTIRWKDNSSNEKSFRIYRNGKYIKSVSAGTTSFTDSGLKPDTAYTYTIKAYNDAGYSAGITIKVKTKKNNDVPITYYIMN